MCGFAPEQPSLASEDAFDRHLPLRDDSGKDPDFYVNTSVQEASVAQRKTSKFRPAPSPKLPAHLVWRPRFPQQTPTRYVSPLTESRFER